MSNSLFSRDIETHSFHQGVIQSFSQGVFFPFIKEFFCIHSFWIQRLYQGVFWIHTPFLKEFTCLCLCQWTHKMDLINIFLMFLFNEFICLGPQKWTKYIYDVCNTLLVSRSCKAHASMVRHSFSQGVCLHSFCQGVHLLVHLPNSKQLVFALGGSLGFTQHW